MQPKTHTLAPGATPIAKYEPILELGRGGMATAFLARVTGVGGFERIVVIKRMHPHLTAEKAATQRFLDEARVAAYVHHAHVVGIHQVGSDRDGYFLVLDYVEGGSLEDLIDRAALRGEKLPAPVALRVALDALSGLHAVHSASGPTGEWLSILHRDISTQNVIVGRDGVARIADFGIAKSNIGRVDTGRQYLVGKLLYMSPEYLESRQADVAHDVYAMGLTLWIALSGNRPWDDLTDEQMTAEILAGRLPSLKESGVTVAPQIERVVRRACARLPSDRYRSAEEMASAIETIGRDTGWIASHAEVARYVEELMGRDLTRRRENVAQWAHKHPTFPGLGARVEDPAHPTEAFPLAVKRVPRRQTRWLVVAALIAGSAAVVLAAWASNRTPAIEPGTTTSALAPATGAPAVPRPPLATTAQPAPPSEPAARAALPAPSRTTPPRSAPRPAPQPKQVTTTPPTGDTISKKNPYQ